jgi:deuterolysin
MVSKILSIAALAGAAMAACPLSVEISGATAHTVNVVVTNTGNEAVTVFKGNTVLQEDHATKDLLVADASEILYPAFIRSKH